MSLTHRTHGLTVGVFCFLLSGCVPSNPFKEGQPALVETAMADMRDAKGQFLGIVTISPQSGGGVRLNAWLVELPAGVHGINIHENGKCDPPDFRSAGAHFSPSGRQHGFSPMGPHEGDVGNLRVYLSGITPVSLLAELVTVGPGPNSLLKPGGTSLIITSNADDQKTDPNGGSGDRFACGVITK
jgi:Cu-Zn family superoxide dismutase